MSDIVIDANVWAMADRQITEGLPIEEEKCIKACRDWLEKFVFGDDRLVVDWQYAIISEYRRNISSNGLPSSCSTSSNRYRAYVLPA